MSVLGDVSEVFGDRYAIRMKFRNRLCGGVPKDPNVQIIWLEKKGFTPQEAEELVRARRAEAGESEEFVADEQEKTWSGFRSDDTGLYIEARQIRAMLRECAIELGLTTDRKAGMRQRLQHGTEVRPERIYLTNGDGPIREPHGNDMAVVHAITPKGKIAAFCRFDFVAEAEIECQVWIVQGQKFTEEKLRKMLILAQETGVGARRSQGEGRFDVVGFAKL